MNTHDKNTIRRVLLGIGLAAGIVGGLATGASASAGGSACTDAFIDGRPGAEISFFAGKFFQENNPGQGWHEDGDPFVAGYCNPNWVD